MKFFTHEIASRNDDRIFQLIDIHGLGGYGFFWVILEELYGSEENGFQIEATNIWMKRLARSLNITDDRTIIRYFDTLADLGLIEKQLWQEHIIYSQGVMKRSDAYMQRKAKEAEKKRKQRSQEKDSLETFGAAPRESLGTDSQSLNVPLADPDPYSDPDPDPDPNSNTNTFKEKSIYKVQDSDFEIFREIWNRDRPSHWAECQSLNKKRISTLKTFYRENADRSVEIFQAALSYARSDFWCNKPQTKLTIDNFMTNNKPVSWAEKASVGNSAASLGNTHEDWLNALERI
jgi:hypothetical protein